MRVRMPEDPALNKLKKQIQEAQKAAYPKSVKEDKAQNTASKYFNVGVELVSGVFVGVGMGLLIDWGFGISPWGLISFFILGSAAGMLNVYRALTTPIKKSKKDKNV
jgi:ATP synthase protein I